MNCCVVPAGTDGFIGVTVMVVNTAGVTFTVVEPLMEPDLAVMVADATPAPVTNPPAVIVAVAVLEEPQVTELVILLVLPLV
jgi:hypothetical protein